MDTREVPRVAAPLIVAAAILLSFRLEKPVPPVELQGGNGPAPSAEQVRAAYRQVLAPGAPGYDRGAARAAVTVVEFSDFGCPYCARFAIGTYPAIAAEFVATGRVRWKYVPFVLGMFPNGGEAARAGICAGEQGPAAFERMHDRLYEQQALWRAAGDPAAAFRALAAASRLDPGRFAACYAGDVALARLRAADDLADRIGVTGTPTFFVDGERVEGALPADRFREILTAALARSRAR